MAKRICIFRHYFFPIDVRVSRQVTALLAAGFEVDVVCLRHENEPARERVGGVSIYRLPLTHRRASHARYFLEYLSSFVLGMLTLTALHLRRRYDVIQVSNMPDCLVFAAFVPKLLGAKIVLDVLDPMPELYRAKYHVRASHPLARLIELQEGLSLRFADRAVTVTNEIRKLLIARHGPKDVPVVLNLPDHRKFPRRTVEQAFEVSKNHPGQFIVLAHGVLLPRHGFDTIIRAIAVLGDEIPGLELRVVGMGENPTALRALSEELGVAHRIQFPGFVPFDRLLELIDESDVGVVANKQDGFAELILPTKLLELVWMGKPVIAARTPTIAHYFNSGMLAFFTPGDERDLAARILELYHDPARRLGLARGAATFFEQRDWQTEGKHYTDVLLDLLRTPIPATTVAPN